MAEHALPVLDVFPQTRKLVEGNGPAPVRIKDRHQELDGVQVEWTPIAIDQRTLQLLRGNIP